MIPVPNPTGLLLASLLVLLAGLALVSLAGGLLSLAWPRPRRYWRQRPWRAVFSSMLLVVLSLPGLLIQHEFRQIEKEQNARQAALHPTLSEPLTLGELTLPAGSRVTLNTLEPLDWQQQPQAHGLQSVKEAELSEPIEVLGLRIDALDLPPSHYFSRVRLIADQPLEGWQCAAGEWAEFAREIEAQYQPSQWRWKHCRLAAGNRRGGLDWPAGSLVERESYGWRLRAADNSELSLDGLLLRSLEMSLNNDGELLGWSGALARALTLGEWQHAAGTRVSQDQPGQWLFTPQLKEPSRHTANGRQVGNAEQLRQRAADGYLLGIQANPWPDTFIWD